MDSLVYRFNHLSAKLELAAAKIDGNVNDDQILTCYEAYTGLVDLVELLNTSFGLQMLYSAILHFSLVLMFIIDTQHLLLFVNFVYIARLFYTINATADKLLSASESSLDQLSTNWLHGLSEPTLFQIEVWMLQFASSKAEVSFASFITLSKSAYVSMVLAATTYAILILQLMASNRSSEFIRMIRGFVVHL
ncbi:uncharacterized protein LOC120352418 [Nilaparvata lugens]|uniref:uncharacterized protein LOC120352418 n=1 Tax=Nilaparvata lugens TaxID=108931 RepID=UPI00193CB444|nr:uncharacterized protein LOC120352418 [Nilaparvata lugens]